MRHINRVTLLGHAGRDPEIRTLPGGGRAATFSLATTERWTRSGGERAEATEWHRVVVYGGAVKAVETRVRKGAAVLVEGRIAGREYRDAKDVDRRITEVVVGRAQDMVNVVGPKAEDGGAGAGGQDDAGAGAEKSAGADAEE